MPFLHAVELGNKLVTQIDGVYLIHWEVTFLEVDRLLDQSICHTTIT